MKRTSKTVLTVGLFLVLAVGFGNAQVWADANTADKSFDTHFHVVSPENWQKTPLAAMGVIDGPVGETEVIAQLDESGVDKAVLISLAYLFTDQQTAQQENDFTAALVRANPDRLVGMCAVSAMQAWALAELERCINDLELAGLKLHLFANAMSLNDPEHLATIDGLFKKAAELREGMPILIDFNWMDDAQTMALIQLALANPAINIIMAHGLGHHFAELINVRMIRDVLGLDISNLYLDISATLFMYSPDSPPFENYMWHLRDFGADRILFGSDFPAKNPAESLDTFREMGFSDEEQRLILSTNPAKLFHQ